MHYQQGNIRIELIQLPSVKYGCKIINELYPVSNTGFQQCTDGGTDEKTGGGDGGGRVEDVTIFIRSDKNIRNEYISWTVWREN